MPTRLVLLAVVLLPLGSVAAPIPKTPKENLQPFNMLIGPWRATGTPEGTREERQRGFWTETMEWSWKFQGDDAWLRLTFKDGKYFTEGELHSTTDKDVFRLKLTTVGKEQLVFEGPLKDRRLTLTRVDDKLKETQQLVVSLLHANRFLYRYEVKSDGRAFFRKVYQVGATKEGEPFAQGDGKPECIVSGGLGTMPVMYKGKTYHVCCSGCRDAFNEDPEKYIREFEEARKEKNGDQ